MRIGIGGDYLHIAICDDEVLMQEMVEEMCKQYLDTYDIEYEISRYQSGIDLLKNIDNVNLVFLDIDMPIIDGYTVASTIRKLNYSTNIVFLTSYAESMQNAFKVKALRYLLKPVKKEEVFEAIHAARTEMNNTKKIIVTYNNIENIVYEKDILYIESLGDITSVFIQNEYFISTNTLIKWLSILDSEYFFKVHKSYIVGLAHVNRIEKKVAIMSNNNKVPISVRRYNEFKDVFYNYVSLRAI